MHNTYKARAIMDWIRQMGHLPADDFGNPYPPEEIVIRLGLDSVLSADEKAWLIRELDAVVEAQAVTDQLNANMP